MNKAVFLDRDGTINVDFGYVHEIGCFKFNEGVFDFCRAVERMGFLIIIITNQSGIERGYYTEEEYQQLTDWMLSRFAAEGVKITECYHCPSLSGPNRKPNPGMFLSAHAKYDIDMSASVSIGDSQRDTEAGQAAGVGLNLLYQGDFDSILDIMTQQSS